MKKTNPSNKLTIKFLGIIVFCLILPASFAYAGTVYFSDDFENGLAQWETGGDAWQLTDLFYRSPNHSVSESPEGKTLRWANSTMTMKFHHPSDLVDLSSSISPVLTFWHRISVLNGDYGYVEISEDYGFTWYEIAAFTNVAQSTWSHVQIDLSEYKTSTIMIRFRLIEDGNTKHGMGDGWDIDDVEIKEKDTDLLPFPFFDDFESGLNNWMLESGSAWQLTNLFSRSSNHSVSESPEGKTPRWASSDLVLALPIDMSSSVFPVLTFWHRVSVLSGDYGYVDISEDGGITWSELMSFTNMLASTWSFVQIDLSEYKTSAIMVRFRLIEDGNTKHGMGDGWDIDDVEVRELFYHIDPLLVQITDIDTSDCPEIQASVIVTDMNDEAVDDLDVSNFSVYENGILQEPITIELSSYNVCASLALDYSGSMEPNALEALEIAAKGFVELMIPGDRGEIIKFAKGFEVMQEYTNDKNALLDAIQRATTLESSATALYDAIYQAISDTSEQPSDSKVVIAMSDGRDNHSEHSASGVIDYALVESVPVFTIGLGDQIDEDVMIAIATKTGGIYYYAPVPEDLATIYQKIAGTLNAQYLVTYETTICDPNNSGDVEYELNIEVNQGTAYGQDTRRFRCPVLSDPNVVSDNDIDSFDLAEQKVIPLVFND